MLTTLISSAQQMKKIVGGSKAIAQEYPWMGSIVMDNGAQGCGASLIHPEWLLTAAHCVPPFNFPGLIPDQVILNSITIDVDDLLSESELVQIDSVIIHRDFEFFSTSGSDIALLHLAAPSQLKPVQRASYEDGVNFSHGKDAIALGWGLTQSGGGTSDTLLKALCEFIDNDTCERLYSVSDNSFFELNKGRNICAGYFDNNPRGAALGDSGGPLFYLDPQTGDPVQVGIVSGGESDITTREFPGVYTLVPAYNEWIDSIIANYTIVSDSKIGANMAAVSIYSSSRQELKFEGLEINNDFRLRVISLSGNVILDEEITEHGGKLHYHIPNNESIIIVQLYDYKTGEMENKKIKMQ